MSTFIRKFHNAMLAPVKEAGSDALSAAGVSKRHIGGIGGAVGEGVSGGLVGAALGLVAGQRVGGLDSAIGPLDAWAAAGLLGASVAMQGNTDNLDDLARAAGGQAAAVFSFRKFEAFFSAKKAATAHGSGNDYYPQGLPDANYGQGHYSPGANVNGEDAVMQAARGL